MLVLSRKMNEQIDIAGGYSAGGITITVVDIRGDKVRIGFEADNSVTIHRREITEKIEESRKNG